MAFISWRDEYSLGIAGMDQEHRELIQLVDELYEVLGAQAGHEKLLLHFNELGKAIRHHIASEEGLMLLRDYPGYLGHHREHQRLYDKFVEYRDGLTVSPDNARVIMEFARAWLIGHITLEDRRYADFLAGEVLTAGLPEKGNATPFPVD